MHYPHHVSVGNGVNALLEAHRVTDAAGAAHHLMGLLSEPRVVDSWVDQVVRETCHRPGWNYLPAGARETAVMLAPDPAGGHAWEHLEARQLETGNRCLVPVRSTDWYRLLHKVAGNEPHALALRDRLASARRVHLVVARGWVAAAPTNATILVEAAIRKMGVMPALPTR